MTPTEYQSIRESIGTREKVAKLLGVDRSTIRRRESGKIVLTEEAGIALTVTAARHQGFTDDSTPIFDHAGRQKGWAIPEKPQCTETHRDGTITVDGVKVTGHITTREYPAVRDGWARKEIIVNGLDPSFCQVSRIITKEQKPKSTKRKK